MVAFPTSLALAVSLVISAGCSSPLASGSEKAAGSEEAPLGGKEDSFYAPTEQGILSFAVANLGQISESAQFLSWTFSLSDDASVSLEARPETANLDTVMYVYHRASTDDGWGAFIAKNDDHEGGLGSRVEIDGGAGEYRVIVKPFKMAMRGDFAMIGECSGEGCPEISECSSEFEETVPAPTGYSDSCPQRLASLVDSEVVAQSSRVVAGDERCGVTDLEATAIDYYVDYWRTIIGYPEMIDELGDEQAFQVERADLTNGTTIVGVDIMADEDHITFVFDEAGELVVLYHNEQSSTALWFCAEADDEIVDFESFYDVDCVGSLIWGRPDSGDAATTEADTTVAALRVELDFSSALLAALDFFTEGEGMAEADAVSYSLSTFDGADGGLSHDLVLYTEAASTAFFVSGNRLVYFGSTAEPELVCTHHW